MALQTEAFSLSAQPRPLLLLDGLLGIGARGPLRDPLAALAAEINDLRSRGGARVAAVDIPSGVDGDTGEPYGGAVRADLTVTIAVPKTGLVSDAATGHVGRLEVIPLEELPSPAGDRVVTPAELRGLLPPRPFDMHKGQAGRVGVVAGSRGLLGAAILAATGALRGGAGLVTLYVLEEVYPLLLAAGPPPELMVKPVPNYQEVLRDPLDVLAVGPGLGRFEGGARADFSELLARFAGPLVVDADALNFLAAEGEGGAHGIDERMVITPHPGEMLRLFPEAADLSRAETARRFVDRHPCTLLYKGARTLVTAPGEALHYNSTGTPGMASGGQGDVLTGLLGALLGGGLAPLDAARAAAWLAGRASERALAEGAEAEESLLAHETARCLGKAFFALREGC
jgi:NAD(P)H-hydrate epimerase